MVRPVVDITNELNQPKGEDRIQFLSYQGGLSCLVEEEPEKVKHISTMKLSLSLPYLTTMWTTRGQGAH